MMTIDMAMGITLIGVLTTCVLALGYAFVLIGKAIINGIIEINHEKNREKAMMDYYRRNGI